MASPIIIVGKMVSNFEDAEMLFLFTCASLARPEALQQTWRATKFHHHISIPNILTSIRRARFDLKKKKKRIEGHYRSRLNKELV